MKRLFVNAIIGICLGLSFLLKPQIVGAAMQQNSTVILNKMRIINGDYFAAGNSVTIDGTINGDAYLGGSTVLVRGKINGDLLAAGGQVIILGDITGNVRTIGKTILINGKIGRNISALGETIHITKSGTVEGSVTIVGKTALLEGLISKGTTIVAGNTFVNTQINGNMVQFGMLTLSGNSRVIGNIQYQNSQKANIAPQASIGGSLREYITQESQMKNLKDHFWTAVSLSSEILSFLASFITGLVLLSFFPRFMHASANLLVGNVIKSLGVGFLSLVVIPTAFIILLISLIGVPLGLLLIVFYITCVYLGKFIVLYAIGKGLAKNVSHPFLQLVIGLLIYQLIGIVPVIGTLTHAAVLLTGIGIFYLIAKKYYILLRRDKLL